MIVPRPACRWAVVAASMLAPMVVGCGVESARRATVDVAEEKSAGAAPTSEAAPFPAGAKDTYGDR